MKKLPQRTCIGCGTKKDKKKLIRIVKDKDGNISIDKTGKAQGRGAYLCDDLNCFEKAVKSKRLERTFETVIDAKIYEDLRGEMLGSK